MGGWTLSRCESMSPYAAALKIGTTACVLSLLEEGRLPRNLVLADAVQSTRDISRDSTEQWIVRLENGKTVSALDVQWEFHHLAQKHLRHSSAETNWLLENWGFVLEAIPHTRQALIGGVDWITKKWLLETFVQAEGVSWDDPCQDARQAVAVAVPPEGAPAYPPVRTQQTRTTEYRNR